MSNKKVISLKNKARKIVNSYKLTKLSSTEYIGLADTLRLIFLNSIEWKDLRLKVFDRYGRACMKCGANHTAQNKMNVDHIKPRKYYPELALDFDNLQVLCGRCNKSKGNKNMIDYRNNN